MHSVPVLASVYPLHKSGSINRCALKLLLLLILWGSNQAATASENDLRVDADVGAVMTIEGEGNTLWLGTSKGLFKWDDAPKGALQQILSTAEAGTVRVMLKDGKTLWIGAESGLFRWDDSMQGGRPQLVSGSPKSINRLHKFGPRLLMNADGGLFVWQNGSPGMVTHFEMAGSYVYVFFQEGDNKLLFGSDRGLFRLNSADKGPVFVPLDENLEVTGIYKEGLALLLGTSRGLLRLVASPQSHHEWVLLDAYIYSLHKDASTHLSSAVITNKCG